MVPVLKKYFLSLIFIILLAGCSPEDKKKDDSRAPEPVKIRIAAVGDFLMHVPLVSSSRDPHTGRYDFKEIFKECGDCLAGPDFTLANLETRLAGPAKGYSGYPRFNTPAELAVNLKELGIDLVATANNHSMDMGRDGVIKTLDNLDKAGLNHVGTYRSVREREQPALYDIRGIKVGFINYTQDTNGIPVPSDEDYLVNLIQRDLMKKEIERLVEKGAQFIIAYIHAGTEYQRYPNEFQRTLARELFEAGVDVVLISHPHVLQPLEWQRVVRDGREKRVLAAYSLGNFISNQRWRYSDCGIILNLDIVLDGGGTASLAGVRYIPVWVHKYRQDGRAKYRVLIIQKAIRDYESKTDPLLTEADYRLLKQAWQDTTGLMGPEFSPVS
ncbi:MAG: CapA family protein [Peptococcaceae bacterium]|nr:CapA family protein [Peptococcaceae bacterium]